MGAFTVLLGFWGALGALGVPLGFWSAHGFPQVPFGALGNFGVPLGFWGPLSAQRDSGVPWVLWGAAHKWGVFLGSTWVLLGFLGVQ